MRFSIQTKLLVTYLLLVAFAIVGLSVPFYLMSKRDKQRESRQHIQIALDLLRNDLAKRPASYLTRIDDFLKDNLTLLNGMYSYSRDDSETGTLNFLYNDFAPVATELKRFGRTTLFDQIMLYGANRRLVAVYQRVNDQERIGSYYVSASEGSQYLNMGDPNVQAEITFRRNNLTLHIRNKPFPQTPLPEGIAANFQGEAPTKPVAQMIQRQQRLGIQVLAPIAPSNPKIGILVGETFYTAPILAEYASLSKTAINLFTGHQFSLGTLPAQTDLDAETLAQLPDCAQPPETAPTLTLRTLTFDRQPYYQGQCALKNAQGEPLGAFTVSLSQAFERQEIRRILLTVSFMGLIVMAAAFGLSIVVSRSTLHAIHHLVSVIGLATAGDLRQTAQVRTHDEIALIALQFNQMIAQLRTISQQVQQSAAFVYGTADTILRQMDTLMTYMEHQTTAVDNTVNSMETIDQFVETVAQHTEELLDASAEILTSIQQTRSSIQEVTTSTGMLTSELHLITSAVEQLNVSGKDISGNTEELMEIAQQTDIEVRLINQSFQEIATNADHTRQLAHETMEAARDGQISVDASLQGMAELKAVVAQTATIIREVNAWGTRVSSILDIVDEITEQTALLSLNASIISAQAGVHGRGFAVVAAEIKNLAIRTKASTKEIAMLVHELQKRTAEGVTRTKEGISKADESMALANGVKNALALILESAIRTSQRAGNTAAVIQQTADSSRVISTSMNRVTEKVFHINNALQTQIHDHEQVAAAVENISGMAEQVNRASIEQHKSAEQITHSMAHVTDRFGALSDQNAALKQNSQQIVEAMHTIEAVTEQIFQHATEISNETVRNLMQQSQSLQEAIKIFKIS